jgi:alpha-tubulin suppressor-like RCC1 family protein
MHLSVRSLAVLALLTAACAERALEPGAPGGPATLTIRLKDASGDVQAAVVTISEVYLQGAGGRTVLRSTPYTVDLVPLATTSTVLLEDVQVAEGTYSQLRFVVTGAYIEVAGAGGDTRIFATAPDYPGLPADAVVDGELQLPSFATSGLKVQLADGGLVVPASGAVSLMVDFDVAQSFGHQAGNSGKWVMHPVITATGVTQGTMLTVTLALGAGVTLPTEVTLSDFRATLAAASAPGVLLATAAFADDGSGTYRAALGFVAPGDYLVDLIAPSAAGAVTVSPLAPLAYTAVAGPATTVAFTLTGVAAGGFKLTNVSGGLAYTCGVTTAGAAYCWGRNYNGQLGDGTTTNRLAPVLVTGGFSFARVAAGESHTCALSPTGAAICWGRNDFGQLGDGSTITRNAPAAVNSNLVFTSISAGFFHTCGLTAAGVAYCWGNNDTYQLGDGSSTSRSIPTAVAGGLTFTSIAAGSGHTCGLTAGGVAYCWGFNGNGQIGDGTSNLFAPTPTVVTGGLTFRDVSAGLDRTCGVTTSGAAYCWGVNNFGQLGDGTHADRPSPTVVAGGVSFASIAPGTGFHTCALTAGGAAYCWGLGTLGQLGDGLGTSRSSPAAVTGGLNFSSMSAAYEHTCALTPDGVAYCWGDNTVGAVGDGTGSNRLVPTLVAHP